MNRAMTSSKCLSIFIIFVTISVLTLGDKNNSSNGNNSNNNNSNSSSIVITVNNNYTDSSNKYKHNSDNANGELNKREYFHLNPSTITYNYSYLVDHDAQHHNLSGPQRNRRDSIIALDSSEIARQNQITEQILTNYLERRLFPFTNVNRKIPTIAEILPKPKTTRSSFLSKARSITETSPTYRRGLANSANRGKLYDELRGRKSNIQRNGQRKRQRQRHGRKYRKNKHKTLQQIDQSVNGEEEDMKTVQADKVINVKSENDQESKQTDHEEEIDDISTEMTPHAMKTIDCNTSAQIIDCGNNSYDQFEGYHLPDNNADRDNNEALQSVESSQYDHYFHNHNPNHNDDNDTSSDELNSNDIDIEASGDADIFKRDPKENEIDHFAADCTNCVDDIQYMNKWTMPLLKLGEKRYYLGIFFKANWFKATQYCRYHGMHLASISSQEENDRLEKHIRDYGLGHEHFWTSGTDLADEGNFFWMSTGRPITFTNWNAGEPNNFRYENGEEENCLELWNRDGKGLKWNDSPCSFETYFVCEVQPN